MKTIQQDLTIRIDNIIICPYIALDVWTFIILTMKFIKQVYIILLILGISGIPCNVQAQVPVFYSFPRDISKMDMIDSGNIRIWYALNATDIKKTDTFDDWQCLEVGLRLSKYYSYFTYKSDSLSTEWRKKNKDAQSVPSHFPSGKQGGKWSEYFYTDYVKNFSTGKLTEYTYMPKNISHSCYTEDIPVQEWTLCEETDTIAGYLCQKAICQFRGRTFVAWFTPDIPINNGPWKFGNLPGLILKVYDMDKLYTFECNKIENFKQAYPIKMYNPKYYKHLDRKKFRKLIADINDNYFKVAGWILDKPLPKQNNHPPLELE
jgi:GLPGLI family protein